MTPNGVEYDLTKSKYICRCSYEDNIKIQFNFSSKLYLEKFINYLQTIKKERKDKINKYVGIDLNIDFYLDATYYSKLEKRGFYLKINGEEKRSFNEISFISKLLIE